MPAVSSAKRHKSVEAPQADVEQVQNQVDRGQEGASDAQEPPRLAAGASRQHTQKNRLKSSAAAASGRAEKAAESQQTAAEQDAGACKSGKRRATVSGVTARPAASQQPSRGKTVAGGGTAATAACAPGWSQPPQTSGAKNAAASKSKQAADSALRSELQQTALEATSQPGVRPLKSASGKGGAPTPAQHGQQKSRAAGSDGQSHASDSEEGSSSSVDDSATEGGSDQLQAKRNTNAGAAAKTASTERAATAAEQANAMQQREMPETQEIVPDTQVSMKMRLSNLMVLFA